MKPSLLNKICAYPVVISSVLGACALNATVFAVLFKEVSVFDVATDWRIALWLLAAALPASLLGYFLGMFTCWPLVRVICSRYNSAPLKPGDHVLVLSGPQKGTSAEVYEITVGQGGWNLARLDLGWERRQKFTDLFEEYCLLKLEPELDTAGNTRPAARSLLQDHAEESRKAGAQNATM